jgi:ABC-type siderophore export system fused ATPase/permease subunit
MQRIEAFLAEDEVPDWASTLTSSEPGVPDAETGFKAATFEWDVPSPTASTAARFQLGPLDFKFPKGKLSLISGATGSGKTATLLALLGGRLY